MRNYIIAGVSATALTVLITILFNEEPATAPLNEKHLTAARVEAPPDHSNRRYVSRSILTSPFGFGAPSPLPTEKENIAAIKSMMDKMSLRTPERYYKMGLKPLKKLADSGDIYAILQLAIQFQVSNDVLESDPDYDFSINSRNEAAKYFEKAALMGNISAVTALSTTMADQDPVGAYAWKQIGEKIGTETRGDYFQANQYQFHLTNDELRAASARAAFLTQLMLNMPPTIYPSE